VLNASLSGSWFGKTIGHVPMTSKKCIWLGMTVGSFLGGYIPSLWGAGMLSMWSMFLSAVGALVGIWAGYQLSQRI